MIWGGKRELGFRGEPVVPSADTDMASAKPELPAWVLTPVGPEPRPPRPLAPSAAGEEVSADAPLSPDIARESARRGVLIHRLLERLPDLPAEEREAKGAAWLDRHGSELDAEARTEILSSAIKVLNHPGFEAIFSPAALPEVPLAATIDGVVVSGTVDRLLVREDAVTVVDFKTTRRPPDSADAISVPILRQMAAYVAALETIYPGRAVRAAILYTQTPILLEIAPDKLAPHKQRLGDTQQSYAPLNLDAY
jgi:ATP-dependent helicase/nuclease subunit A